MRFSALIFKNLLRHKTRSSLAILGIPIGIAASIALGAVMSGMTSGIEGILKPDEADAHDGNCCCRYNCTFKGV